MFSFSISRFHFVFVYLSTDNAVPFGFHSIRRSAITVRTEQKKRKRATAVNGDKQSTKCINHNSSNLNISNCGHFSRIPVRIKWETRKYAEE